MDDENNLAVTRQAIWCLSLLTFEPLEQSYAVPIVERLASTMRWLDEAPMAVDYAKSMNHAVMALSKLSDGPVAVIDAICSSNVVLRLAGFLRGDASELKRNAIRVLSNVSAGTEQQTQLVIDAGVLPLLSDLLNF